MVKRNDLYYKKFTNVPFSGIIKRKGDRSLYELSDHIIETFENGKKTGPFQTYYNSGELLVSGNYKDGKKDDLWEYFNEDGSILGSETFKNGQVVERNMVKE